MNDTEQVIDVPKISCPTRLPRAILAATLKAEQLVEVPVVSASSCVHNALVPQMVKRFVEVQVLGSRSWWCTAGSGRSSRKSSRTESNSPVS